MRSVKALALAVLTLPLTATPARADHHHRAGIVGVQPSRTHLQRHHHFPRSVIIAPFGLLPGVAFASPVFAAPPVYDPPPVYVAPPPAAMYPSPPPAVPRVVYYPTGRYELYGDGVTTPYQWVWIPNPPPPPPPPPAPPSAPPSETPEPQQTPSPPGEVWSWTDAQGTTHWTDHRENVPEAFRAIAQRRG